LPGFAPNETANDLKVIVDEKIKPWIKTCHQDHKRCSSAPSSIKLPARVIDVGHSNENLRLCVPAEDGETSTRYLTLSYCWGAGNASARTTRANFTARRREIDYNVLPKTIRDAIDLTRALGERLLWVDAVCIIQPDGADDEDWRDQAPLMWQYYRDSVCTIAASRATDSSEGFLDERIGQRHQTQICEFEPWENPEKPGDGKRTVHVHPTSIYDFPFNVIVDKSPLSQRAWVLQEYALSTRVLHWTKHELLWECAEMCAKERFPEGLDRQALGWRQPHLKLGNMQSERRDKALGEEWLRFVRHYSKLDLTFESDRLAALAGVAVRTKEYFKDEYIFGLWKSQLLLGLAWQAGHFRSFAFSNQCNAPSWSWASCHGVGVKFRSDDVFKSDMEVEIVRVDHQTDHNAARRTNSEYRLVLKGFLERLRFKARRTICPHGVITNRLLEKARFSGNRHEIVFDSPHEIPAHVRLLSEVGSFDCLKLCVEKTVDEDGGVMEEEVYLVLKEVDTSVRRFRRIGIMRRHVPRFQVFKERHGVQAEIEII
jgi:hypothetical protein